MTASPLTTGKLFTCAFRTKRHLDRRLTAEPRWMLPVRERSGSIQRRAWGVRLARGDGPAAAADQPGTQRRRGDRDGRRLRAAVAAAALLGVGVEAERERRAHMHRLLRVLLQPRRHRYRQDDREAVRVQVDQ